MTAPNTSSQATVPVFRIAVGLFALVTASAASAAAVGVWMLIAVMTSLGTGSEPVARIAVQAGCAQYNAFVLDQARAGLTIPQIEALVANSDRLSRIAPREDLNGTRAIDDPQVCGPVRDVLTAAQMPIK